MTRSERLGKVEKFLNNKPGYLKEGVSRFRKALKKKAFDLKGISNTDLKSLLNRLRTGNVPVNTTGKPKRLFYDIETSYNIVKSWRVGYNLNINPNDILRERAIICVCYKWEGDDNVYQLRWDKGDDSHLVREFIKVMNEADELVGHNIDRYDTTFLLTRAIHHGIMALPKYNSYDTLKKARTKFRFNSNKLDYIAKFLGLGGKYKHPGMEMWDKIILDNNPQAMEEMVHYCAVDVVLTEDVYKRLSKYTEHNVHHGVLMGHSKISCPNDGSLNTKLLKPMVTKAGTIKRLMICEDCGQTFFITNKRYLNSIK